MKYFDFMISLESKERFSRLKSFTKLLPPMVNEKTGIARSTEISYNDVIAAGIENRSENLQSSQHRIQSRLSKFPKGIEMACVFDCGLNAIEENILADINATGGKL